MYYLCIEPLLASLDRFKCCFLYVYIIFHTLTLDLNLFVYYKTLGSIEHIFPLLYSQYTEWILTKVDSNNRA